MNASPRRIMNTLGWQRMICAITGSFLASARRARSQYSGFMQRQIEEQVLRLHAHRFPVVARKREIDRAPCNVAPHDGRVSEVELEEREDMPHPPLLHLTARPQLVHDRGRLGVEADVPGPRGFLDLADRLDLNF